MSSTRVRHPLVAVMVLALGALPPASCTLESVPTLCQVDGVKKNVMTEAGMRTLMYVNPVVFVRVYGGEPYEGTFSNITLLNNNMPVPRGSVPGPNVLVDPGGQYVCFFPENGMPGNGLGPFDITGMTLNLSMRVTMTELGGSPIVLTAPVGRLRPVNDFPPNFMCNSTRCGR